MRYRSWRMLGVVLLGFGLAGPLPAQTLKIGPQEAPQGPERMQLHWIWSFIDGRRKETVLQLRTCRPAGDAPAPAVVINHGSPANAKSRPTMKPGSCDSEAARWFLQRGWVVAFPLRRGYGETGGDWAEAYGSCSRPNFVPAGLATADDIDSAVRYVATLDYVQPGRTLVVGQSAGGWGTVAYASRNPQGVAGLINFAGGRGGWAEDKPNTNCGPDMLYVAAHKYGATAQQPMLWVYTRNDTFFSVEMSQAMHGAFTAAGGKADFRLLDDFGKDGHGLFFGRGGSKIWGPLVEGYLASLLK
jgi:dienelactone hydrolase